MGGRVSRPYPPIWCGTPICPAWSSEARKPKAVTCELQAMTVLGMWFHIVNQMLKNVNEMLGTNDIKMKTVQKHNNTCTVL